MKSYPQMKPGTYNAAQVLEFTANVMDEDKRRVNMKDWILMRDGIANRITTEPINAPDCGTIACVAGWICLSTRCNGIHGYTATDKLSLSSGDIYNDLWNLFNSVNLESQEVVDTLRNYIECYREELETKVVYVVAKSLR